jgi:hypothetical protein
VRDPRVAAVIRPLSEFRDPKLGQSPLYPDASVAEIACLGAQLENQMLAYELLPGMRHANPAPEICVARVA